MDFQAFRSSYRGLIPYVIIVVFMTNLVTAYGQDQTRQADWSSFRGGKSGAVATDGGYPTSWNIESNENVKWKVKIPGQGNSSPILHQDCVIVTTAYSGTESVHSRRELNLASTGVQWLIAMLLGLCLARDITSLPHVGRFAIAYWGRAVFVASAGTLLLLALELGVDVFTYQRCPIRSWIGAHLAATLCAAIALSLTMGQTWMRRINVAILLLISLSVILLVPAKDHAYRHFGPQAFVVLGSGAVPLVLVVTMGTVYVSLFRKGPRTSFGRFQSFAIFAAAILGLGAILARVAGHTEADRVVPPDFITPFFHPTLVWLLIAVSMCGAVLSFVVYRIIDRNSELRRRPDKPRTGSFESSLLLISAVTGGGIVLGGLAYGLNSLIPYSTFLQYHLPTPNWGQLDFAPIQLSMSVFLGSAVAFTLIGSPIRKRATLLRAMVTVVAAVNWPLHVVVANNEHHEQDLVRAVVALDREDGSQRWIWEGFSTAREAIHRENTQATPTAAASGTRVIAYFGNAGLVCLDARSGRSLWTRADLGYCSTYGAAASPVISDQCVIVVSDAPASARIVGLDLETGETIWEHDRSDLIREEDQISGHSRTPLIVNLAGHSVALVYSWNILACYDVRTGRVISQFELPDHGDRVASGTSDDSCVYFGNSRELVAITRESLSTDKIKVAWRTRSDSNCVSPVTDGQQIITCSDRGVVNVIDIASGRSQGRTRLKGEFRSSPIIAGSHLYLGNLDGTMHIMKLNGTEGEWSAVEFHEPIFATPAASNSQLFVRTESSLYRLH